MFVPPEREFYLHEAEALIAKIIKSQGYELEIAYSDKHLQVSHVLITDRSGFETSGSGKGSVHHLGAIAEALEHYSIEVEAIQPCAFIHSSHNVANQPEISFDAVIATLTQLPDTQLTCIPFSTTSGVQTFFLRHLAFKPLSHSAWSIHSSSTSLLGPHFFSNAIQPIQALLSV